MRLSSSAGTVDKAKKLVESVLKRRGCDPLKHEIGVAEGGAAWALEVGSARLLVALNPGSGARQGRLRVAAPVVKVPQSDCAALWKRLLELNGTVLPGVAFGLVGDEVVLVAERSLAGIDAVEVEELLALVGHYADEYDEKLAREYGGTRVCDLG